MQVFTYRYRPGYGSSKFLIEFENGVEDPDFFPTFMDAIREIHPVVTGSADLWMNNEFQLHFTSALGPFTFSKDIWNFAFIEANNNQECVKKIDALLSSSSRFERTDVSPEDYK